MLYIQNILESIMNEYQRITHHDLGDLSSVGKRPPCQNRILFNFIYFLKPIIIMKEKIQTHQETQVVVNCIKELLDNAVMDGRTVQDVARLTKNFCYKCLQPKPINPDDCELCN
jgi:hypothetical protein